MSVSNESLWPFDIDWVKIDAPVGLLKKQASFLGTTTKNLVEAKVEPLSSENGAVFKHAFYLVAPALDNYKYRLLTIEHPIEFYPVTINFEAQDKVLTANNYDELVERLRSIFSDEKTKTIIQALLAQSQA